MPFDPTTTGGVLERADQLDVETRRQLEKALEDWRSVESDMSRQVDDFVREWEDAAQPLMEAISQSERLTQDDFAIRINARD